ncbi:major capsid protein [Microvirus mar51]|uniref:Major capsid protein n=1 Tax=Microvirus mar51 TaxID=2851187 RepID=A0A8F5RCS2_9VIRU|nr:major capsid protein [Microvirus mar51]
MSKVFGRNNSPTPKPKRNSFDLSFTNNLTLNFGGLYPVLCKEVLPGDTFKIDTTFGLRFMPMYFPLQTKMRADIHYFYVRNRNLWKDWPDFVGKTKPNLVPPFINAYRTLDKKFLKTGSLADYLGVPTTWSGRKLSNSSLSLPIAVSSSFVPCTPPVGSVERYTRWGMSSLHYHLPSGSIFDYRTVSEFIEASSENPGGTLTNSSLSCSTVTSNSAPYCTYIPLTVPSDITAGVWHFRVPFGSIQSDPVTIPIVFMYPTSSSGSVGQSYFVLDASVVSESGFRYLEFDISLPVNILASYSRNIFIVFDVTPSDSFLPTESSSFPWTSVVRSVGSYSGIPVDYVDSDVAENPFTNKCPLSALPFRAYESIYNAFYRDDRNNPYVLDGSVEYNEYLPTKDGGSDNTDYQIRYRNWEQDFLTTAVPTPQQGDAPLVGITSTGVATFVDESTGKEYQATLSSSDGDHVDGVTYTENLPGSVARSLVNVVSSGISINDFRNVNAFQRWLETNVRKGLKYKDQIESHFGVNISYAELDMPEFIGGVTQVVDVRQIDQQSQTTSDSPLGSYAGQAYAVGRAKHKINKFFDEHGFIIGILSVSPVPVYSQLLPKHFTKTDSLDYFFPEFGHIGLQPIPYREVCPVEAVNSSVDLSDTFGYQRAWYDYLASVDEVHGLMRTELRDFLISRFYGAVPRLTPDFLTIRPEQTNQVFSVTDVSDKILGLINFNIQALRPIPRFGVPRLE